MAACSPACWPTRTAETVTILDANNKRTVLNRNELEELHESETSLMPEKLLDALSDQQIRDLFAFLSAEAAPPVATKTAGQ